MMGIGRTGAARIGAIAGAVVASLFIVASASAQDTRPAAPERQRERAPATGSNPREMTPEQQAEREKRAREAREARDERARQAREGRTADPTRRPLGDQTPADPWIRFDPPVLDLGVVPRLTSPTGTVKIYNIHDSQITLVQPVASCACTVPALEKLVIEPGEFVEMSVKMDVGYPHAKMNKTVTVRVAGQQGAYTLAVSAESSYKIRTDPAYLVGKDRAAGGPLYGNLTLEAVDGKPFKVLSVQGKPPVIPSDAPAADADSAKHIVEYAFEPEGMPPFMIVRTTHPEAPVIDVKISHAAVAALETRWRGQTIKPVAQGVNIGDFKVGESREIEIHTTRTGNNPGTEFKVGAGEEVPGFTAELLGFEVRTGYKNRPETVIKVKVTNNSLAEGPIIAPIYLGEASKSYEARVYLLGYSLPAEPTTSAHAPSDGAAGS